MTLVHETEEVQCKKKPLVFGDPKAALTVGTFVQWLEERFEPHAEKEEAQAKQIEQVNKALLGNGTPEEGVKYKVDSMWETTQKVEVLLTAGRRIWLSFVSLLGAAAMTAAIGHNLGWW